MSNLQRHNFSALQAVLGKKTTRVLGVATEESNFYQIFIEIDGAEFVELYAYSPIFAAKNIQESSIKDLFRTSSRTDVLFDLSESHEEK